VVEVATVFYDEKKLEEALKRYQKVIESGKREKRE